MARKVRFALEMNNGAEVRSMEEFREHFSLAKVLEYFNNGKLVIWLRDHYENSKADNIEQLDKTDKELTKKICEIFDIAYDENSQEELEKATLRAERIEKLKNYTTEKKYINNIDNVAFDQDELYDLLDENADKIYLCGDRFHIPLEKSGIAYIGINNPIVVIDSKVEVDWHEKEISLVDVAYDEKYQTVLDSANETKEKLYEKIVETVKAQSDEKKIEKGASNEVIKFLSLVLEKVEELHDRDWDYQYDSVCEEFELEEIDPDDYGNNEYDYSSKAKAKHACKEQLTEIINDVKEQYQEMRSERYDEIIDKYESVNSELSETLHDIVIEILDFFDECEDEFVSDNIMNQFMDLELSGLLISNSIVEQVYKLADKLLPQKTTALKKVSDYLEECDYDSDEDDMYSYDLEAASEKIIEDVNDNASSGIDNMYDGLEIIYHDFKDALGVYILKGVYNFIIDETEEKQDFPELINIDELTAKLIENNNVNATAKIINRSTKGLFGIMNGVKESDLNLSQNGRNLLDLEQKIKEYINKYS